MKFYLIEKKWPVYYKEGDMFIPLYTYSEIKDRTTHTHKVVAELNHLEALNYIDNNPTLMYNEIESLHARDKILYMVKELFYKEVLHD